MESNQISHDIPTCAYQWGTGPMTPAGPWLLIGDRSPCRGHLTRPRSLLDQRLVGRTLAVETMGLEPTTSCLQSRRSAGLSYVPGMGWKGGGNRRYRPVGHRLGGATDDNYRSASDGL